MRVHIGSLVVVVAASLAAAAAYAQSSPRETVTGTVGGKKVAVEYGRPSLKGRKLDDLLAQLPPDRIWRAGDNQVTTLTAESDILVGGAKVPAGKYSLYVLAPASGDWSLVLNKDPGIALSKIWAQAPPELANAPWPRLDGYANVASTEVARVPMKSSKPAAAVEMFTIFLPSAGDGAVLSLLWSDRTWSVDVKPSK